MPDEKDRSQAVIEEVYRMMGQPVPDKLKQAEEEEEEEEEDGDDYEEDECEEEEPEDPEIYIEGSAEQFRPELTRLSVSIAQAPVLAGLEEYPETRYSLKSALGSKQAMVNIIRLIDTFVGETIRQTVAVMLELRKASINQRPPHLAAIAGVHISESGYVGLMLKSSFMIAPVIYEEKLFNILIQADEFYPEYIRLPFLEDISSLLFTLDGIMTAARELTDGTDIHFNDDVMRELWTKSVPPTNLEKVFNDQGAWRLKRYTAYDYLGYPADTAFPIKSRTFWLEPEWEKRSIIRLGMENDGGELIAEKIQ